MEQHSSSPPQQEEPRQSGWLAGVPQAPQGISAIYFNGFAAGMSMGDIAIPISLNGVHFATLNVSYSMAKTLAESLTEMISNLEKATGNHIMTAREIEAATSKSQ